MSVQVNGELATCACGAYGGIVERSPIFDPGFWCVIEHEGGERHKVETVWTGEAYRFKAVEDES